MVSNLSIFMNERLKHFKKLLPLSTTFFFYLLAWGIVIPIFNIKINEVTGSLFLSGIIFSLFGFIRIFFDPATGLLCDRINPKKILQASFLAYALIFLLYTLANNFELLFVTRFLHAIAGSMIWVSGWTLVRRKSKGHHAQEEISTWTTIQNIAYVIAPIIGGIIISATSWQPVYYIASITCLAGYIYTTIKVDVPENHNGTIKKFSQQWKSFFKNKSSAVRLSILTLILFTVTTAFGEFLPLHLNINKLSIGEISVIIAVGTTVPYILFPVVIGIISDKYGRKIPTIIGLALMSIGFLILGQVTTFTQFLFYTFVVFTGSAFIGMCVNAELNDLTKMEEVGGFTGIFEMIKDIGIAAGPLIAGYIASGTNIAVSFLALAVISISSIVIMKGFKNY